ncbi:hypothetical protein DIPPA_25238 [Diplonema papillatum]|nr:hypothetical protein DIPPA_25238 [Diplonema papillatum]
MQQQQQPRKKKKRNLRGQIKAALIIQCHYRRVRAKRLGPLLALIEKYGNDRVVDFAYVVQCAWRWYRHRARVLLLEEKAAVFRWRLVVTVCRAAKRFKAPVARRHSAATLLQKNYRNACMRRFFAVFINDESERRVLSRQESTDRRAIAREQALAYLDNVMSNIRSGTASNAFKSMRKEPTCCPASQAQRIPQPPAPSFLPRSSRAAAASCSATGELLDPSGSSSYLKYWLPYRPHGAGSDFAEVEQLMLLEVSSRATLVRDLQHSLRFLVLRHPRHTTHPLYCINDVSYKHKPRIPADTVWEHNPRIPPDTVWAQA